MRIASLLPAATEWICAMGAGEDLVARSHECDFPPEAVDGVPVVTAATYASGGDSKAIDDAVQGTLQEGLSLYEVDLERLEALAPDVVVTQAQCDVCAVTRAHLDEAVSGWAGGAPQIVSLEPTTMKEVMDAALRLGRTLNRAKGAMAVIAEGEKRIADLRRRMGHGKRTDSEGLPTIACIEWLEPLMAAGHWMPDVAEHAGARAVLAKKGAPSSTIAWEALREADPDVIAVMPCGFSIDETRRDLHYLTDRPGWTDLTAVQSNRVALLDGNAYFNRPGPRLYRAVELLASVVNEGLDVEAERWEREEWMIGSLGD